MYSFDVHDEMNLLSLVRSWQDNNCHKKTKSTTVCYNIRCDFFYHHFTDPNTTLASRPEYCGSSRKAWREGRGFWWPAVRGLTKSSDPKVRNVINTPAARELPSTCSAARTTRRLCEVTRRPCPARLLQYPRT